MAEQCQATTNSGEQCGNQASEGSDFCWRHQEEADAVEAEREVETTEAQRDVQDTENTHEVKADLQRKLANKRCRFCGKHSWKVTRTMDNGVRHIKCRGCQRTDKVAAKAPNNS